MSFKQKVFINTLWSLGGQIGNSLVQLIANIIFARFLTPLEFGQLGIVMFFVLFSNVLVEGGLGGALVRKNEATKTDFSTVFLFNFFISILLYGILFFNANVIANYYNDQQLKGILKVIGIILIINSLNFVQNTRLVKDLQFHKITKYRLTSITLANIIGILLVIYNFGVWALVISMIMNPLIMAIILWTFEGPVGKLRFSINSFKGLYNFGINTTLASIIDTTFNNIYQLILGKYFSISEVGLFFQAKKLQDVPNSMIFGTTNSVIFSSLSKLQYDAKKFNRVYFKIISHFSVLMGLVTLLVIVFSKQIILLLFGMKWISSAPYLVILASASFFYVHEMFNRVIFKTFNKTNIILKLELVKKSLLIISIVLGILSLNIKILLIGFIIISGISYFINYFYSRKILATKSWNELISLFKVILAVLGTLILVHITSLCINLLGFYYLLLVPLTILLYILILLLLKFRIEIKQIKALFPLMNGQDRNLTV